MCEIPDRIENHSVANCSCHLGYGKFSLRLTGSAMFGATFNLVTSVGVP